MWGDLNQEIAGMEDSRSYIDVPKLIDFFKSEMPLRQDRHMGKQEYHRCRPGNYQQWSSTHPYQVTSLPAASPEPAIADGEERQPEPSSGILVDFLGGINGHHHLGVDAAVLNRSSSVEVKHIPMAKLKEAAEEEHWSSSQVAARPNYVAPTALKILSPTSTGTEESGTAAPKTPTCDMEITCRPCVTIPEHYADQGSTFSADSGRVRLVAQDGLSARHHREEEMMMRKVPKKEHGLNGEVYMGSADNGISYGRKRMKRVIPARIAPPLIRSSEPVAEQTPTSRDVSTQTQFSDPSQPSRKLRPKDDAVLEVEDDETVVQAATSLLSLSSDEGIRRPAVSSSETKLEREPERPLDGEREIDEREVDEGLPSSTSSVGACSVLSRPSNKRRYRLVVDLLGESPRPR